MASNNIRQNIATPDNLTRPFANFHPSTWGDYFLSYASQTSNMEINKMKEQVEDLKEEVKSLLISPIENHLEKHLELVDSIQRLGISYHFETEIDEILEKIYKKECKDNEDLHSIALRFRLLRQKGYHVSCDVFNKVKDKKGNFKDSIVEDVKGMLSLYEASHLRIHGESILDEAINFTISHLKAAAATSNQLSLSLAEEVNYALDWPIHLGYPRLHARNYISVYQKDPSHNHSLLTFAKIDFNILQKLYQKELSEVTRWWNDYEIERKLTFARSRIAECYLWALGLFYEPKYSMARMHSAKLTAMVSILDDIYDSYGSFQELELLTHSINRWENNNLELLPEYMKVYFQDLLSLYEEIERDISVEGKPYLIYHAKEAMKRQARSYLAEAKWLHERVIPTIEEYMKVSVVSTCYYLFIPTSFIYMGNLATIDVFQWVDKNPNILQASGIIGRLMNDIVSRKFEQEREHIPSAIECYMKQHGVSEHEALNELNKQLVDAWKNTNEQCIKPTELPLPLLMNILNLDRTTYFFYKDEDAYTHAKGTMKEFLKTLMVDSIPL